MKCCNLHLLVYPPFLNLPRLLLLQCLIFLHFIKEIVLPSDVLCVGKQRHDNTVNARHQVFWYSVRVVLLIQKSTFILVHWAYSQMVFVPRLWWISSCAIVGEPRSPRSLILQKALPKPDVCWDAFLSLHSIVAVVSVSHVGNFIQNTQSNNGMDPECKAHSW